MFCSKCGNQLNDGVAFCGACGNPVVQASVEQQQPVAQTPAQEPDIQAPVQPPIQQSDTQTPVQPTPTAQNTVSLPDGFVTIPKISEFIVLGLAALMFIFMLLPWFKYGISFWGVSYTEHFSIFTGDVFEWSALIGIAKIFGIINIIVFIVYALLQFFDVRKLIPAIPENIDLKKYSAYAFGGIYVLEWLFTLIGMIATKYVGLSPCFVVAFVFAAAFAVAVLMPNLLDKLLKDVFNINKN